MVNTALADVRFSFILASMTWLKDLVILTLLIGTLFGATLGNYPLAAPDGARYAEIPREMVVSGDYVTPHLNGVKYFEKPPLFYWLQAVSIKAFGVNDFAVSLVNAIMALGCCLFAYVIGCKIFTRLTGLLASLVLATSGIIFALTRVVTLDVTLTFFLTACLSCFLFATQTPPGRKRNGYLWGMYIAAALAVMTKGLVGIIFPGAIIFFWLLICNEWRSLKSYRLGTGLILFLLLVLPWHIAVQIKNPEFFHFYFLEQHFLRYLTTYAGRVQRWWFLPAVAIAGFYPWILFLPQTLYHHIIGIWRSRQQNKPTILLLLWVIVIYAFYTFSDSKLIPYILPIYIPLAVMLGNYLANYWQTNQHRPISLGFNLLFGLNIAAGITAIIAIFTLDFTQQAISRNDLYTPGALIILGGICTLIAYRRRGLKFGFGMLSATTAILLLSISPIITIINKQSIKPLISILQTKLQPQDEVVSFSAYYQDLPFYLQRIVTVAAFHGELAFGMQHQDTHQWMIDAQTFWQRWNSHKRVYMIIDADDYRDLVAQTKATNLRIIATNIKNLLVVNSK